MKKSILNELVGRIAKALSPISPDIVQFVDFDDCFRGKPLIQVMVVASGMEDIRVSTRWRICQDLIAARDPEILGHFSLAFEAFTPREHFLIRRKRQDLH